MLRDSPSGSEPVSPEADPCLHNTLYTYGTAATELFDNLWICTPKSVSPMGRWASIQLCGPSTQQNSSAQEVFSKLVRWNQEVNIAAAGQTHLKSLLILLKWDPFWSLIFHFFLFFPRFSYRCFYLYVFKYGKHGCFLICVWFWYAWPCFCCFWN